MLRRKAVTFGRNVRKEQLLYVIYKKKLLSSDPRILSYYRGRLSTSKQRSKRPRYYSRLALFQYPLQYTPDAS